MKRLTKRNELFCLCAGKTDVSVPNGHDTKNLIGRIHGAIVAATAGAIVAPTGRL